MDATAPAGSQHKAHWIFYHEIDGFLARKAELVLEVFVGERLLGRRVFRRGPVRDRTDRPLVFMLHIPKTAGTSLRGAMEQQPAIGLLGVYPDRAFVTPEDCMGLSSAAFDDLDVVIGHFHHGFHRHSHRAYEYMAVMRHPAEILKSYYLFMKSLDPRFRDFQSIEEAVAASIDPTFDNGMTRYMSGKSTPGLVNRDDLDAALRNMERDFAYVGTVEAMRASLNIIGTHIGAPLACHTYNVTPPSREGDRLDLDWLSRRFAANLAFDMPLYEHALALFAAGPRSVTRP